MKTKKLVLCAAFTALTAIGAFIKIPIGISTITLQFLFTMLASLLLGVKYGVLSQLLYVILGLIGLPIFSAGGGFAYVSVPTFGYIIGLIPAALVIALLTRGECSKKRALIACIAGLAVLYFVGILYMAILLGTFKGSDTTLTKLLMSGMIIYLPGDALKIAAVVLSFQRLSKTLKLNLPLV